MKLPAIPFLTKKVDTQYFLSLIFELDKVSSILYKEQEKALQIVGNNETKISLEDASVEDLVIASDTVISRLESKLPEGATLEKTIFSVPYSWVEDGKINSARLTQLKKISVELALVPMGFIISIEAIIAFMQKKSGAPVHGIFVEISDDFLSLFIVRAGNIIDVKRGVVTGSVEDTCERLLGEVVKLDVLPSKIILLNNEKAINLQQKFLAHHWTKDLPFMHLPQVVMLEKGFENEAIINGVASQMNVSLRGEIPTLKSEEIESEGDYIEEESDAFGFVKDEDVAQINEQEAEETKEELETPNPTIRHTGNIIEEEKGEEVFEEDEPNENEIEEENEDSKKPSLALLGTLKSFIPKGISLSSLKNLSFWSKNGRSFIIPGIALVVVILIVAAYYSFFLKAQVILFTDQKAFSKDSMAIDLTTNGQSSFEDGTFKISTLDETVSGEESQETTGQKDTGDKATGTVTIFNKTDKPQSLDKGTTISSSNNLEFTLDDDVKIASTSSFSTSFSNEKVNVTASDFGKEYNLPSDTNFTIEGISASDIFARNDTAFSGGSKSEIQVVSQDDLTALQNTVVNRLFDKAKDQAKEGLGSDEVLIPVMLDSNFKQKTFSKKADDEAKNVSLNAQITYTLGVYTKEDLQKFLTNSGDFSVPNDFKLSDSDSQISISNVKQGKNGITADLSYNVIFKPNLTIGTIPQQIAGASLSSAQEKLKQIQGVSDATIVLQNKLPILPSFLPFRKSNISVELKTQ